VKTTDYQPIDCDQHSLLELLAMRRTPVTAKAVDADGGSLAVAGTAVDVLTRDAAEYLVIRDADGADHSLRLDRLHGLFGPGGELLWRQTNATTQAAPLTY
jgi:transcriptional antiterminator Rof (Rho-off)